MYILASIITIAISISALVISIYSTRQTKELATSDFSVSQHVKSDTIKLTATLISLMYKGANSADKPPPDSVDISHEKKMISKFLTSPTSISYYLFGNEKGQEAGQKPEDWRTFVLRLNNILSTDNPMQAAIQAARVLDMLVEVNEDVLLDMSESLSDLSNSVTKIKKIVENDMILEIVAERARD